MVVEPVIDETPHPLAVVTSDRSVESKPPTAWLNAMLKLALAAAVTVFAVVNEVTVGETA
ncbi:MAG: hypothetical protein CGW95_10355 [Phenylobacterium zucineum]|nr:MAG: hypothetical protein CGW95_10355 [Phenylobacterium zucineum]